MIDQYDLKDGWTRIEDPFTNNASSLDKTLEQHGFENFAIPGKPERTGIGVDLFRNYDDGRWFITFDSPGFFHPVLATSFPAMLAVFQQAQSFLLSTHTSWLLEVLTDIQELLVDLPSGPLHQADMERRSRDAALRAAAQRPLRHTAP
jgi:hypothetical protein